MKLIRQTLALSESVDYNSPDSFMDYVKAINYNLDCIEDEFTSLEEELESNERKTKELQEEIEYLRGVLYNIQSGERY